MLRRLGWTLRGWWWYGKSHIPHPPSFKEPLRANKGLCPRPRPVAHAERAAHCARLKRPQKGLSLGGCRGARLETYLFSHAYTGPYRCFVGHAIYLQFLCLRSANKPSPPVRIMCRGRRFMPPNANANLAAHRAENITAEGRVRRRVIRDLNALNGSRECHEQKMYSTILRQITPRTSIHFSPEQPWKTDTSAASEHIPRSTKEWLLLG